MRFLLPLLLALGTFAVAAPIQTVTHPNAKWAFYVDAQKAVAVDYDGAAAVIFPRQGAPRAVKVAGNGKLRAPLVTPEGRILAVGLDFPHCEVAVWGVTAGRKMTALRGDDFTRVFGCDSEGGEFIFGTQFTSDGRFLLTQDTEGLRRWDARTGRLLKTRPGKFFSLHVSPDGRSVATVGEGRRVELWTSDLSRRLKALPPQPSDCYQGPGAWPGNLSWSPDSTRLAYSCAREVRVWKVAAGGLQALKRERKVEGAEVPVFSPDGRFVVANEDQFGVAAWHVGSGRQVAQMRLDSAGAQVTDVKITPGGLLLAALRDGRLARLDLNQPARALPPLPLFSAEDTFPWPSLAVSPDGTRLAAASGDGRVAVWTLPGE